MSRPNASISVEHCCIRLIQRRGGWTSSERQVETLAPCSPVQLSVAGPDHGDDDPLQGCGVEWASSLRDVDSSDRSCGTHPANPQVIPVRGPFRAPGTPPVSIGLSTGRVLIRSSEAPAEWKSRYRKARLPLVEFDRATPA
jgi:hypothetical protein